MIAKCSMMNPCTVHNVLTFPFIISWSVWNKAFNPVLGTVAWLKTHSAKKQIKIPHCSWFAGLKVSEFIRSNNSFENSYFWIDERAWKGWAVLLNACFKMFLFFFRNVATISDPKTHNIVKDCTLKFLHLSKNKK